jgi:hypothetical protein
MGANPYGPPRITDDGVVRFEDADHFLRELTENLRRGRLFARADRGFENNGELELRIEGPGVDWTVGVTATIVHRRRDYVGIELRRAGEVMSKLDLLGEEVKAAKRSRSRAGDEGGMLANAAGAESTVIQVMPDLEQIRSGRRPKVEAPEPTPSRPRRAAAEGEPRTGGSAWRARGDGERPVRGSQVPTAPSRSGVADPAEAEDGLSAPTVQESSAVVDPRRALRDMPPPSVLREEVPVIRAFAPSKDDAPLQPAKVDRGPTGDDADETSAEPVRAGQPRLDAQARAATVAVPSEAAPEPRAGRREGSAERAAASNGRAARASAMPEVSSRLPEPARPTPEEEEAAREKAARGEAEARARLKAAQEEAAREEARRAEAARQETARQEGRRAEIERLEAVRAEARRAEKARREGPSPEELAARAEKERKEREAREAEEKAAREAEEKAAREAEEKAAREAEEKAAREAEEKAAREAKAETRSRELAARAERAVASPAVDDLAAPAPAAPITAAGLEALTAATVPVLRSTGSGVVRVKDPANLLGLYLCQIRHKTLTLLGGPDGEVGSAVTIKIASHHIATLSGRILARIGDWVTVELDDGWPIAALLKDDPEPWLDAVRALAGHHLDAPAPSSPPVAATLPPTPVAAPAPATAPEPEPEPEPEDDGPPEAPELEGDAVRFRRRKDLAHEIATNLKNGGLSVRSPALKIREHRTLEVWVSGASTGVKIEADVVFAGGGLVGFSVGSLTDVVAALELALAPPRPAAAAGAGPRAEAPASMPPRPAAAAESQEGRIARPPSVEDLTDLQQGRLDSDADLDRASVVHLLEHLARTSRTGVLTLRLKDEVKVLYYHEGSVAFVESRPDDEETRLGRILVQHKKLTEPALREGVERAQSQRKPLGRTLVGMGLIKAPLLAAALREQMRSKVSPAFAWSAGNWELKPWREPPTSADLVLANGMGFVARHVKSRFEHTTANEAEALFAADHSRIVTRAPDGDKRAQGLGLQQKEMRFMELMLDGRRSLSEAVTGSPLGRLASIRVVAFGLAFGLLSFEDGQARLGKPRADRGVTDGLGHEQLRRSLSEALKLLRTQNHFEVLGVHWSASHRQYAAAYQKVKRQYDLERAPLKDAPPEIKAIARDAAKVVDEAYKTLEDADKRISYRKQLFDATEREYSADMLIKQAEVLILRGDRLAAIESFETAYELNPSSKIKSLLNAAREGRTL